MLLLCRLQEAVPSSKDINVVAGFSKRDCRGSVLLWNNATADAPMTVSLSSIPFDSFTLQAFRLDTEHMPGVRPCLMPVLTYAGCCQLTAI